jgi:hypothetical protein
MKGLHRAAGTERIDHRQADVVELRTRNLKANRSGIF